MAGRSIPPPSPTANPPLADRQEDPELASYLEVGSDLAIREEEREARRLRVQALGMETEKLRQQNEEARRKREVRHAMPSWQKGTGHESRQMPSPARLAPS